MQFSQPFHFQPPTIQIDRFQEIITPPWIFNVSRYLLNIKITSSPQLEINKKENNAIFKAVSIYEAKAVIAAIMIFAWQVPVLHFLRFVGRRNKKYGQCFFFTGNFELPCILEKRGKPVVPVMPLSCWRYKKCTWRTIRLRTKCPKNIKLQDNDEVLENVSRPPFISKVLLTTLSAPPEPVILHSLSIISHSRTAGKKEGELSCVTGKWNCRPIDRDRCTLDTILVHHPRWMIAKSLERDKCHHQTCHYLISMSCSITFSKFA